MERRAFLGASAVGLAWLRAPRLAAADGQLYELTSRPINYESPRAAFTERITPIDRFYIRNHFDAPTIDAKVWKLAIRGTTTVEFSLADLEAMKQTTIEAVLQCAGNGRGLFVPRVAGVQWKWGAMGNAEWTGVKLADLIARAKPAKTVTHAHVRGAEKPTIEATPAFVRALPIAKAMHADTIVALKMNGKPLAPLHGFPARLVVPGWVGDDWIKWLATIELADAEPKGFWYETAYRFPEPPGKPGEAVPPEQMKPMTRLVVKSLIGSIAPGDVVAPGDRELVGVAFSGEARIAKVEVTVDGGATWKAATLDKPDSAYGFRVFRHAWKAAPGKHRIAARATDSKGATQSAEPVWNPSGYLHNAIEYVDVEVKP
jgi:sulfite oxidase